MSTYTPLPYRLKASRFASGVHRAFLVDADSIPEPYSTLYVTQKLRNASRAVATQVAALNAVNVLFAHAEEAGIDLVERFKSAQFLDRNECEALRRSVQVSHGPEAKHKATTVAIGAGKRGYVLRVAPVARGTQYQRLTYIAHFVEWLAGDLAGDSGDSRTVAIASMKANIQALRPDAAKKGVDSTENTFTREDDALLRRIICPGSSVNPFLTTVQVRNALLVEMLRLLGKRRGEALNIRVREIDLARRQIDILRRADDKDDPRPNQPLVKTRSHTVPIGQSVVDLINQYLVIRRAIPGATKQPYFFVTHKAGPTQGQPMTIEALKEVFRAIKRAEPRLAHLHPHLLRHFNNDETARVQQDDSDGEGSSELHRRQRNYLNGRAPDSGVDSLYTLRETQRQARAVSLRTQDELTKAIEPAFKATRKQAKKP